MRGQIVGKLLNDRGGKGSRREDAYVRFAALVAAIVSMVLSRNMQQSKIDWFLAVREKKGQKAFPAFLDRIRGSEAVRSRSS